MTAASPTKQVFLDMHAVVAGRTPAKSIQNGPFFEDGLMGLAFHPGYAVNGYFYATNTVRIDDNYYFRLSRFAVDGSDPNLGDPSSELILLQQFDEECVANTDPLDDASYLVSEMSTDGNSITVKFSMPAYRSAYIMAANDFNGPWERWNAPGNNGIMRPPGLTSITGLATDEIQFFRLVMEERRSCVRGRYAG